jgi:hypothetical protein
LGSFQAPPPLPLSSFVIGLPTAYLNYKTVTYITPPPLLVEATN